MNGLNKSIAEKDKSIANLDKSIAEKEQHTFIIRTTDSIREKLLPLLAAYLGADSKKQQEIRNNIIPLAKALKDAEVKISSIKPHNEENAREQRENIARIQELFTLILKTNVRV